VAAGVIVVQAAAEFVQGPIVRAKCCPAESKYSNWREPARNRMRKTIMETRLTWFSPVPLSPVAGAISPWASSAPYLPPSP
jgi:hypothetical protein